MFAKIWHKISQFWKNCQIVVLIVRKVIKIDLKVISEFEKNIPMYRIEVIIEVLNKISMGIIQ